MSEAIANKPAETKRPELLVSYELKLKLRTAYIKGLVKFHQQVKSPKENGYVEYQDYHYVKLEDLINSINNGLKDTGLTWLQDTKTEENVVSVRTIILHEDGHIYESSWVTIKTSGKAQDIGSAMTYAKRYSLGTAFGVSSEPDDDGQQANNYSPSQNGNGGQSGRSNSNHNYHGSTTKKASDKQVKMIYAQFSIAAKRDGKSSDQMAHQFLVKKGISDFREMTSQDASNLIGKMTAKNEAEEKAQKSQSDNNQPAQNNPATDPFAGAN